MGRDQEERKRAFKKSKRNNYVKIEEIRGFFSIDYYENVNLLKDDERGSIASQTMLLIAAFQNIQSSQILG
jgi:hypothetical protein